MISKITFIALLLALIALLVSPVNACEPPEQLPWFRAKLTVDPITLPDGIELTIFEDRYGGVDGLTLSNHTEAAIYIIYEPDSASELFALYEASEPGSDKIDWTARAAELNIKRGEIRPEQSITVLDRQSESLAGNITEWPWDYGGQRPDNTKVPDPLSDSITFVHQGGVQRIPYTVTFLPNPEYPAKAIWNGCPEEVYEEVILPTAIVAEDTAVFIGKPSNLLWIVIGFGLLVLAGCAIYWIHHRTLLRKRSKV